MCVIRRRARRHGVGKGRPESGRRLDQRAFPVQRKFRIRPTGEDAAYEHSPRTRFGLTYTSEIKLDFSARAKFSGLTPVLQALLQDRGLLNADLDVKIKVPQTAMGNFFHQLDERWAILGSVGWQDWSQFGHVEIGIDSINPTSVTVDLPFNDTWHGALGTQYRLSPTWLLNFGVAYDDSFQDENDVSPLVPVGETWRFAIGAQYAPRKDLDIGLGFVYAYTGNLDVNKQSLVRGDLVGSYNDVASVIFSASANWRF